MRRRWLARASRSEAWRLGRVARSAVAGRLSSSSSPKGSSSPKAFTVQASAVALVSSLRSPLARKKRNDAGALPCNYARSVREYVDWDYANKLSKEDREWLAWFGDCYYGADFRTDTENLWSPTERRARYAFKNSANRGEAFSTVPPPLRESDQDYDTEALDQDWEPTPEYLNSPEYKTALAAYRATLAPGRPADPEETPKHYRAQKRLENIVGETIPEVHTRSTEPERDDYQEERRVRPTRRRKHNPAKDS